MVVESVDSTTTHGRGYETGLGAALRRGAGGSGRVYDTMRERMPIAYDGNNSWTVFGHADTVAIVDDVDTFSNSVSRHLQIPNGIDGEQHRRYRGLVDTYFTEERLTEFEPTLRQICADLIASVPRDEDVDFMTAVAEPFANNVSCAFMGWPDSLRQPLRDWTEKNRRAVATRDRTAIAVIAIEFDGYIRENSMPAVTGRSTTPPGASWPNASTAVR